MLQGGNWVLKVPYEDQTQWTRNGRTGTRMWNPDWLYRLRPDQLHGPWAWGLILCNHSFEILTDFIVESVSCKWSLVGQWPMSWGCGTLAHTHLSSYSFSRTGSWLPASPLPTHTPTSIHCHSSPWQGPGCSHREGPTGWTEPQWSRAGHGNSCPEPGTAWHNWWGARGHIFIKTMPFVSMIQVLSNLSMEGVMSLGVTLSPCFGEGNGSVGKRHRHPWIIVSKSWPRLGYHMPICSWQVRIPAVFRPEQALICSTFRDRDPGTGRGLHVPISILVLRKHSFGLTPCLDWGIFSSSFQPSWVSPVFVSSGFLRSSFREMQKCNFHDFGYDLNILMFVLKTSPANYKDKTVKFMLIISNFKFSLLKMTLNNKSHHEKFKKRLQKTRKSFIF